MDPSTLFLHVDIQFFQLSLKGYPFSTALLLHLCQKPVDYICECEFTFGLCSILSYVCPLLILQYHDYCTFIITLKIRQCHFFNCVLYQIVLAILNPWIFLNTNFRISLPISTKKPTGILIRIVVNLYTSFGRTGILPVLSLL